MIYNAVLFEKLNKIQENYIIKRSNPLNQLASLIHFFWYVNASPIVACLFILLCSSLDTIRSIISPDPLINL